jgi:ATP synthase protein I
MSDKNSPKSDEDFASRLRQAQAESRPPDGRGDEAQGSLAGLSVAFRIGLELVSALVVGVGIGYLLDRWLETKPLFLVVFFFVGAAAGMLNVYRSANSIGAAPPSEEAGAGKERDGTDGSGKAP